MLFTTPPLPTGPTAYDETAPNGAESKPKFGSKRGIETLFRTSYPNHMDLSAIADSKSNIMISINGIIISVVLASISPKIDANPWLLFPTAVLLLGCLVSMIYAVLAAMPRVTDDPISLDDVREGKANLLFFGHFTHLPASEYVRGMKELVQDNGLLYTSMMRDIYGLGRVLQQKFRLLRVSYIAFMSGLITGVVMFLLVYALVAFGSEPSGVLPRP